MLFIGSMKNNNPLVSIITSMYKGDDFIENFMQRIVEQTFFDKCELILIDANSPDAEYSKIVPYLEKYDNIIYERLAYDPGIYETWTYAINKSRGKYITNANLDDERLPTHIEVCVNELERNNSVSVVSTSVYVVYEDDKINYNNLNKHEVWFNDTEGFYSSSSMFKCNEDGDMDSHNIPHCCPVWRKNIHDQIDFFDEFQFKQYADWEFWLRAMKHQKNFYHIKKPLAIYRNRENSHNNTHTGNESTIKQSIYKMYVESSIKNKYLDFNTQFLGGYGKHRSGWDFVMNALKPTGNKQNGILFSSFIERDFGWKLDGLMLKRMMALGWVGIAHAPPNYPNFISNIVNQKPDYYVNKFKYKMLWKKCRGLFTLSKYLANEWKKLLPDLKIEVLHHPSENPYVKFDVDNFLNNKNKKIIQIGYWLRKLTSILKLKNNEVVSKAIISPEISEHMPHIAKMWSECVKHELNETDYLFTENYKENKNKLYNLCAKYDTQVISHQSNSQYDELLSKNIVFLDFYDISASNLVIECILRITPILVRKHSATIEYLGRDYPFYFETLEEANDKANNLELILFTHEYMKRNINKYNFTAEKFVNDFYDSDIYKSLEK